VNLSSRQYGALLATYLRPQWRRVALLALLIVGSIALDLANPLILRGAIDAAQAKANIAVLIDAALLYIGVALVTGALSVVETYVAENVAWSATNGLRGDLALHLLRLDLSFHHRRTPGELIERVDGDVTLLANFFARFAVSVVGNVLLLAGILVLLFGVDARVGAAMTLFAAVALVAMVRVRAVALPHYAWVRAASAAFFGFLGETLAATEDIRSSGATGYVMGRFSALTRDWLRVGRKAGVLGYTSWMTTLALFGVGMAVAFALGAYLFHSRAITLGTVYLIFGYTELLRRPTDGLRTQLQDLQQAGAGLGRIQELLGTRSRLSTTGNDGETADNAVALPPGALSIAFDDVRFAYDSGDEPVLHDISFRLAPGRVLGLLGRTGSGKSTLARLALRLYDPTDGVVRLGGVDLRHARLAEVRRRVGMVTQEVQLFAASVRDNVTMFDPTVSDERAAQALDEVGLGAWYRALPRGLDDELGAESGGLSAGEAQLLAFARVFLKDPDVVILDEASSRLDPATERLLQQATERLLHGRTAIIVAHRLATVERADRIMVLDAGRIVEHDAREILAADPASRFARLLQAALTTPPTPWDPTLPPNRGATLTPDPSPDHGRGE